MYHQLDTLKGADLGLHSRHDSSNYGFKKEKKGNHEESVRTGG
jgi:hypothetical protein